MTPGREKSVHFARYLSARELKAGIPKKHLERLEKWPRLNAVRDEVLKALEVARQDKFIGGSLEARVVLAVEGDLAPLLEEYRGFLPALFIVSQVELARGTPSGASESELPGLRIKIEKATGQKCERCWNYSEQVGQDRRYPSVCERCSEALKEIEASA
jgi:isoleucyl-tRNA synthetase